jgi:TPR repeat protein
MRQETWSLWNPKRDLPSLAVTAMCLIASTAEAQTDRRVALVVGNGDYTSVTALPNPSQDADLLADQLRALDFDVIEVIDANHDSMVDAVRDFGRRAKDASAALFYYAGHGLQSGGENYLLPVDATIEDEADLRYESLALTMVMEELAYANADISLVILDACRDNPLNDGTNTRSIGEEGGLATVRGATGTLIAYATAPGKVAYDGAEGNSPFSGSLAEWIAEPGLEIGLMFRRVRQDVVEATGGLQVPWIEEAIIGDFYFVPGDRVAAPVASGGPRPFDIADADSVFWRTIEEMSTEQQRRAGLNLYLQVFPEGKFAGEANQQLVALDTGQAIAGDKMMAEVAAPGAGAFTDLIFWEGIKSNPTVADLERYLYQYPDGLFAGEALSQLDRLRFGASGGEVQVASILNVPYGVDQFPMGFRQAVAERAIGGNVMAEVKTLPEAGRVEVGGREVALGDAVPTAELQTASYYPAAGLTGPMGDFAVAVPEQTAIDTVLSAKVEVGLDQEPIRKVAAGSGIGPVPITLTLPPTLGDKETTVTIDALPHRVRLLTPTAELTPGVQFNMAGSIDVALAVPDGAEGDLGEIVYSFEQPTRGVTVEPGEAVRESIEVAGLTPDYDVQTEFDAYLGVGAQPLPVSLPADLSTKVLIEELPFGDVTLSDGGDLAVGDYLDASALSGVTFEAHRHMEGPAGQFVYSYKDDQNRLVQAIGIQAAVHDCDLLATDPFDPDRVTDGSWLWKVRGDGRKVETFIDSAAAILACLSAADQFPNVDRFRRQVARAYAGEYDFESGLPWLLPLAEKNDPGALAGMGRIYAEGAGVPQSYEKSFEFYKRSAELGYIGATHEVGKAYRDGRGVRRDYEQGAYWIEKAADWGFVWAQLNMAKNYLKGLGVRQDDGRAVAWFQKAIDQDNGWGMIMLGRLYLEGRGVPQSVNQAMALFQQASDEGLEHGDIELAKLYLDGKYVEKDPARAVELLKLALSKYESNNAKVELAKLMLEGTGTPKDPGGAVRLLQAVIDDDDLESRGYALTTLARAYENGSAGVTDLASAVHFYQQAADLGHGGGTARLARLYLNGKGVAADPVKARELFEAGATRGHTRSALGLAEMQLGGQGGPVDIENGVAWLGRVYRQTGSKKLREQVNQLLDQVPATTRLQMIQTWLTEEGYNPGPADGLMGPATRDAIVAFEGSRGLVPQGEPSVQLLAELSPR